MLGYCFPTELALVAGRVYSNASLRLVYFGAFRTISGKWVRNATFHHVGVTIMFEGTAGTANVKRLVFTYFLAAQGCDR